MYGEREIKRERFLVDAVDLNLVHVFPVLGDLWRG